jgi:mannose-6-phosphate isomerase-like protein (cupin superfamily)
MTEGMQPKWPRQADFQAAGCGMFHGALAQSALEAAAMKFLPDETYALLDAAGGIRPQTGGREFWGQSQQALDALGRDWLVSEFACDADWGSWEMHPQGEEFVYLLDGDIEFQLETPEGVVAQRITGRGAVVVPRGVWHTAKVFRPSRLFFITMGAGTQHRPV